MGTVTALQIVERSMRMLGALESGEDSSTNEQSDGLEALNDLIDSLSNQSLMLLYRVRDSALSVSSAANSYTIGSGYTFNTAYPVRIDSLAITSGSINYPVPEKTVIQERAWQVSTQAIPEFFYYQPVFGSGAAPYGIIYFPTQLSTSYTVTIDSLKPVTQYSTISEALYLAPGHKEFLVSHLAIRLAPEFKKSVPPAIAEMAKESRESIERASLQYRKRFLRMDPALARTSIQRWNVINDR